MKVVIDTNSLLSLVRYYLPFDKKQKLLSFIQNKIAQGEVIIIDKVFDECLVVAQKLIVAYLPFLTNKQFQKEVGLPYKTGLLIAPSPQKFLRMVDNNFVNTIIKKSRRLTEVEYERQKEIFLNDADVKMIILCLHLMNEGEEVMLVTEETEISNDHKLFKKIPAICKELNVSALTLPMFLQKYTELNLLLE